MVSLRTPESAERFRIYRETKSKDEPCPLCTRPTLHNYTFWKVIVNDFPYDRVASVHHMIVPIRHVREEALTTEELVEFQNIKETFLHKNYDFLLEATFKQKSIPDHFHIHLITLREDL